MYMEQREHHVKNDDEGIGAGQAAEDDKNVNTFLKVEDV